MQLLIFSFLASSLSFSSSFSSSLQKTTNVPILPLLSAAALSSFLTKLVRLSETSRAKIIATGFPPLLQTRQSFLPIRLPLQCNGLNGVGDSPTCRPDLDALSSANALHAASAIARAAPIAKRCFMLRELLRWDKAGSGMSH